MVRSRVRSTSTYLTQKVVPMLPRLLCEELCSLNPGVERLAFSAVWELTAAGEVRSPEWPFGEKPVVQCCSSMNPYGPKRPTQVTHEWFGRSIIRSACKLDYAAAQRMIETAGSPAGEEEWSVEALPLHGGFSWEQVGFCRHR